MVEDTVGDGDRWRHDAAPRRGKGGCDWPSAVTGDMVIDLMHGWVGEQLERCHTRGMFGAE
jgi:hypothetical protein